MASPQTHDQPGLLMERGVLGLSLLGNPATIVGTSQSVEIHRGMTVQSAEGCTVGHVAAVLLDQAQHQVTHILLQELQQVIYRLTPVGLIEQVRDKKVALSILLPIVESLPAWPGASQKPHRAKEKKADDLQTLIPRAEPYSGDL